MCESITITILMYNQNYTFTNQNYWKQKKVNLVLSGEKLQDIFILNINFKSRFKRLGWPDDKQRDVILTTDMVTKKIRWAGPTTVDISFFTTAACLYQLYTVTESCRVAGEFDIMNNVDGWKDRRIYECSQLNQ